MKRRCHSLFFNILGPILGITLGILAIVFSIVAHFMHKDFNLFVFLSSIVFLFFGIYGIKLGIEFDENSFNFYIWKNTGRYINLDSIIQITNYLPMQMYIVTSLTSGNIVIYLNKKDYYELCVATYKKNPKCMFDKRTVRAIKKKYNLDLIVKT
jgi:hypothetical protein